MNFLNITSFLNKSSFIRSKLTDSLKIIQKSEKNSLKIKSINGIIDVIEKMSVYKDLKPKFTPFQKSVLESVKIEIEPLQWAFLQLQFS